MKFSSKKIDCLKYSESSMRKHPFTVIEYIFNYQDEEDKTFLDNCIDDAKELSNAVNPKSANLSTYSRSSTQVFMNSIAGILAEKLWIHFLNKVNIIAESTIYDDPNNQIDIKIVKTNKTMEIRSSFPFKGLEFALCHPKYQFDVIGPYVNEYKPNEIKKDFYGRVLYPFSVDLFYKKLKSNNLEVYLTGGATWTMMGDREISIKKDFVPQDIYSLELINKKSEYLVIPFSKSLDMKDIIIELNK
ncbi:hypothetical protein N9V10_03960 [Candidatus Marinimicrobia bacterium]|nr:hypothetical protein [Candidatus Neomarinimicrobiota bacterium]